MAGKDGNTTILKFGGTSVQDAQAISQLVKIVQTRSGRRVVVVSALARVTDGLLQIAEACERGDGIAAKNFVHDLRSRHLRVGRELGLKAEVLERIAQGFSELELMAHSLTTLREVSPRSRDALASQGEFFSSVLVHGAFEAAGQKADWIDSRALIVTNSEFTSAQVDFVMTNRRIIDHLDRTLNSSIVVTQGFVGSDIRGITTTLGRGGSDYSAAVYGAALQATKVEIWTDVDGILSTDPRVVPNAAVINKIHFLEAAEMAYFGAKVLHPATIYPALSQKIPVWILNSKNPTSPGTEITFQQGARTEGICGIAFKKNITLVNIYSTRMLGAHGFLKSVFDVFARHKLSVDLISTSEVNISLTLDPNSNPVSLQAAKGELAEFSDVEMHDQRAMVAVVGGGVRRTPGLAAKLFGELKDINIHMISMGASELNLSFVVDGHLVDQVVQRLHSCLIEAKP